MSDKNKIIKFPEHLVIDERIEEDYTNLLRMINALDKRIFELKMELKYTPRYKIIHRIELKHNIRKLEKKYLEEGIDKLGKLCALQIIAGYQRGYNDGQKC